MRTLGIDYGRRKIGLAISVAKIAEPLMVIVTKSEKEAIGRIIRVVKEEKIERVVVGISEGEMAKESKAFSLKLEAMVNIPVEMFDETLSTLEAQELSKKTGIGRDKRKRLEDAFAACVMLQSYLEQETDV
jgi:putative Holliday junction resolvase